MYIPRSFLVALVSAPFLAFAQSEENPFNNPSGGYQVTAGQPLTLSWKPTTDGTVSLSLRMGNSGNLGPPTTIVDNIPNSGSYTWQVPADTVRGSSYTIEISSDSNPDETNYTPPFILESTNNAAPTSSASTAASTVTPSSTRSSASASSDSATTSSPASTTGSSSASSSSVSATDSSSSDSASSSATSSGSSSSASESSASSTNNADLQASATSSTQSSNGGAARATAMAGMLGVVALGALAL